MDIEYLRRFVPQQEMAVIMDNPMAYIAELERVERQIRAMPQLGNLPGKDEVKIGMHYFGGATDFWVYALEVDGEYAEAFVCLNGDAWNAECGPIYIPELLPIAIMNLDLHWDSNTRLVDVMERVRRS